MPSTFHTTAGGKVIEFFDPMKPRLMRAANKHPKLVEDINNLGPDPDWSAVLGEVAAYVVVLVDGDYMPSELDKLAEHLYWKLEHKLRLIGNKEEGK